MKKLLLTAVACAIMSSATAATLDVQGDIKINGKTVIDNSGKVISVDLINMADYEKSVPSKTLLTNKDIKSGKVFGTLEMNWDGENYAEYEDWDLDKIGKEWQFEMFKGQPNRSIAGWGECNFQREIIESFHRGYPAGRMGQTVEQHDGYVFKTTNLCTGVEGELQGVEMNTRTPLAKISYKKEGVEFSDCLLIKQVRPWNFQLRTLCKGPGLVEILTLDEFGDVKSRYELTELTNFDDGFKLTPRILAEPVIVLPVIEPTPEAKGIAKSVVSKEDYFSKKG
jgi:hypothetical protein